MLKKNLLTYKKIPSKITVRFVGVPCSQPAPGIVGQQYWREQLARRLVLEEPYFLVGLNLEQDLRLDGFVHGRTLPTVVVETPFSGFDDYLAGLRSDYRRRIRLIRRSWNGVEERRSDCSVFGPAEYALYEGVYERSQAKLEKLGPEFFRNLDNRFVLTRYYRQQRLIGWHITLIDGDVFYFFLEGHDPSVNDVYFNMLLGVMQQGLESGAARIDLGQTAEIPKMRLGGRLVERRMFATHQSRFVQLIVERTKRLLEYNRRVPETHVFRT